MKTSYSLVIIAAFTLCIAACKKDLNNTNHSPIKDVGNINQFTDNTNQSAIAGKWNIVSDSTYAGVGSTNHPVNYIGVTGDYFDFRTDGNIYTKEGVVLDTLSYRLVAGNGIIAASFGGIFNGVPQTSHITNLTAHTVTIASPEVFTPGGVFWRKVSLSR